MKISERAWLAAHVKHALAVGGGNAEHAIAYAEGQRWLNRERIPDAIKAATTSSNVADFGDASLAFSSAFLEHMADTSVPARLVGMRPVPFRTQVLTNTAGVTAVEVAEGGAVPVLKGTYTAVSLTPRRFSGIIVESAELARSPSPVHQIASTRDLASAVADALNRAFCDPTVTGSIFNGAATFGSAGTSAAQIDTNLRFLLDAVRGSSRPGAAWIMAPETASYLCAVRGSGGDRAFPNVTALGGELLGLPILLTAAMATDEGSPPSRCLGLVQASEIFFATGAANLETSTRAALQMSDAPTTSSTTPTATTLVSLFQANAIATKATLEAAWKIRSGGSAYYVSGF